MVAPMKSILDPTFRYVPAAEQDLKKTFARVRREQEKEREAAKAATSNVAPINPRKEKAACPQSFK